MRKFINILFLLSLLMLTGADAVNAQRITVTIAGNGYAGNSGNGVPSKFSTINGPHDVCVDAENNIYFIDAGNSLVKKIAAKNGVITVVAGGGMYAVDGVPATSANLLYPQYMCIDATGNIYITTVDKVRKISATGIITTVAGTNPVGYSGDGGAATAATLNWPEGVCVDAAGNIYVVDRGNDRVRKITAATGIITTIAGTGAIGYSGEGDGGPATAAALYGPVVIAVNSAGDIFFTDQTPDFPLTTMTDNSVIRKISAATGTISTIAGSPSSDTVYGTRALHIWLGTITGLCIDRSGNLYFNEISCSCRELDIATDTVNMVGGNFDIEGYSDNTNSLLAYMSIPYGLCVDAAGNVYAADSANNRIRKQILLSHTPTFAYGGGQSITPCAGYFAFDSLFAITDMDTLQTETWTVITAPANGMLAGFPATAMSGGLTSLASPTGTSYTPNVSYSGADSFRVRVSDGTLSDTITMYISVGLDNPGTITGVDSVCIGSIITLNDSADGSSGTWISTNGNATVSSSGALTGVIPGIDTIIYTVVNSCGSANTTKQIMINDCTTGINTLSASPAINIFPNPASTVLNIVWVNLQAGNVLVIITDITGRELYRASLIDNNNGTGSMQINVSAYPPGMYFININGTDTRKFMKE